MHDWILAVIVGVTCCKRVESEQGLCTFVYANAFVSETVHFIQETKNLSKKYNGNGSVYLFYIFTLLSIYMYRLI